MWSHTVTRNDKVILQPVGFMYFHLECKPEERQNADQYVVTVVLITRVEIISASCTFVAGSTYTENIK